MSEHVPVAIGIDVGGSGIKGAAVDLTTGRLASNRHRILTPQPATPQACLQVIARIVKAIVREMPDAATAPIGVGVPSVVIDGVTKSAANIDPAWVGFHAEEGIQRILGRPVRMVNDADAAGLAEMRFGAGRGRSGTVLVLTLGTGLGSGFFVDGRLVPNTELGHMEIRGRDAERRSAAAARVRRGLSWKAWAEDLDEHLNAIHRLFWPSLLIVGGGVSKNADKFLPRLTVPTPIVAATLRNEAGIVGAAMFAAESAAEEGFAIPSAPPGKGSDAAEAAAGVTEPHAERLEASHADSVVTVAGAASEADATEAAEELAPEEAEVETVGVQPGMDAGTGDIGRLVGEEHPVRPEPSVTVAPAWAADIPEGDAHGYAVAPATMASSIPEEALEEAAEELPAGVAEETPAEGAEATYETPAGTAVEAAEGDESGYGAEPPEPPDAGEAGAVAEAEPAGAVAEAEPVGAVVEAEPPDPWPRLSRSSEGPDDPAGIDEGTTADR